MRRRQPRNTLSPEEVLYAELQGLPVHTLGTGYSKKKKEQKLKLASKVLVVIELLCIEAKYFDKNF